MSGIIPEYGMRYMMYRIFGHRRSPLMSFLLIPCDLLSLRHCLTACSVSSVTLYQAHDQMLYMDALTYCMLKSWKANLLITLEVPRSCYSCSSQQDFGQPKIISSAAKTC